MNNNDNCLANLLEKILLLQHIGSNDSSGCDRPILGNINQINANTRPINLYCCCTNALWTMPYDFNGTTGTSSVFRIESLNDNCATFRILIDNDGNYTATDNFFIIDLDYVSCIKCLEDSLVSNI
ncbi:MAG: hypothetical protein IJ568_00900 [Bacilli bacterium]|nr:hypothetical protein [Bacilli bacterium]